MVIFNIPRDPKKQIAIPWPPVASLHLCGNHLKRLVDRDLPEFVRSALGESPYVRRPGHATRRRSSRQTTDGRSALLFSDPRQPSPPPATPRTTHHIDRIPFRSPPRSASPPPCWLSPAVLSLWPARRW